MARDAATECRKVERRRLRLAAHWCVLHPGTADAGFATWDDTGLPGLCPDDAARRAGHAAGRGVHARAVRGRARGVHPDRVAVLADALDLEHRLPRIWAAVEELAVAPWRARQIAQATHHLS